MGHSESVYAVAFSPDGKVLASTSEDNTLRFWHVTTGSCKHTLAGHKSPVHAVAFSPDGKVLASASYDKTVQLWDAITGAREQTFDIYTRPLSFSDDGRYLKTDRGLLSFNSSSPDTCPHQEQSVDRISNDRQWVSQDGQKNILWLPPEYRPLGLARFNNLLVLGHESGQVTFLEFAQS